MNNLLVYKKAFTLVEVLLYMALTSIIVLVIASMWVTITETRDRSEAMSIVNAEGQYIVSTINQIIRDSNSITSPTATNSGSSLTLAMTSAPINPTVINLSSGNITLTEGANPPVNLNSNRVTVSSLIFRNLTRLNSAGIVRIEITLNYINGTGKQSLNYSQTFYGSASIR